MAIIDFLFPKHCPVCLRPLLPDGRLICPECRKRIPYIRSPFCLVCGAPVAEEEEMTCKNCRNGRAFDRGVSWADYTDPAMRRMIARVKFHGEAQLLDFPCRDLAERKKELLSRCTIFTTKQHSKDGKFLTKYRITCKSQ